MFGLAAVTGDGSIEGHHTVTTCHVSRGCEKKRKTSGASVVFRSEAAKRSMVCCGVFPFLSNIRKTRTVYFIHVNPERSRGASERSEPTSEGGSGGPAPENFKNLHCKWCNLRFSNIILYCNKTCINYASFITIK